MAIGRAAWPVLARHSLIPVLLGVVPGVVPAIVPGVVPESCRKCCPNGILESPPLLTMMMTLELLLLVPDMQPLLLMMVTLQLLPVAAGSLHGRLRRGCRLGD